MLQADSVQFSCSVCGAGPEAYAKLVLLRRRDNFCLCDECVKICHSIVMGERRAANDGSTPQLTTATGASLEDD